MKGDERMSWNNPTSDEAQECYDSAVSRYNSAAEDYCIAKNVLDEAGSEWRSCNQSLDNAFLDERKCKELIGRLSLALKQLGENGTAENRINEANSVAKAVSEALQSCIKCSGINCPDSTRVFSTEHVKNNHHSQQAVELLKKELDRQEQICRDIIRLEQNLKAQMEDLESKINSAAGIMSDASRTMKATTLDMEHYEKYIDE